MTVVLDEQRQKVQNNMSKLVRILLFYDQLCHEHLRWFLTHIAN
jgi:hypothetical protein